MTNTAASSVPKNVTHKTLRLLTVVIGLQIVAAVFFIVDGVDDVLSGLRAGLSLTALLEFLVAFALCAGIIVGSRIVRQLTAQFERQEATLRIARGAMAEHIASRFAEWGLTVGESDVALFALKGCSVSEIAELRESASGTVRSQLSQIYAKAGVTSQSMLMALFIEDLLQS